MFWDIFLTRMKIHMRSKESLIWSLVFSIALGTLFYAAFGSIYNSNSNSPIPVALVTEGAFENILDFSDDIFDDDATDNSSDDNSGSEWFSENSWFSDFAGEIGKGVIKDKMGDFDESKIADMLTDLEYDDGTKILEVHEVSMKDGEKLLDDGEVDGIIDMRKLSDIQLVVKGSGIKESILSNVVSVFRQFSLLIQASIKENSSNFNDLSQDIEEQTVSLVEKESLAGENKDPFVAYFYCLIAMMCIMASMAGLAIPISCQANLSDVGARVNVSPMSKVIYEMAAFLAAAIVQSVITVIGLIYFLFVLKIEFGGNYGAIFLTGILGTILGVAMGFFVGHIGSFTEKTKETILMTFILGGGFLSGLMYGNMKVIIEEKCPIINRINPSAVLTDAFYALNMYGISGRYYRAIIFVVIMTAVLIVGGLIMSREESYASL